MAVGLVALVNLFVPSAAWLNAPQWRPNSWMAQFSGSVVGVGPVVLRTHIVDVGEPGRGLGAFPDDDFLGLPVSSLGGRRIFQFREREYLSVDRAEVTHEGPFEDALLRDGDDDRTGALAVEILILQDERIPVGILQFDTADELEVLAEDGELLTTADLFAVLLGKTGNGRLSEGQRDAGFHDLAVLVADFEHAAFGSDAGGSDDADHLVADEFEARGLDAAGEFDLGDIREAGTVDGHRLPGHHLGGEEHLDAQAEIGRLHGFLDVAGREQAARQDDGEGNSYIVEYLLHN